MSSSTFILTAGCVVFAVVTVASLWVGYILLQRAWVAQNPDLSPEDGSIGPFLAASTAAMGAARPEPLSDADVER